METQTPRRNRLLVIVGFALSCFLIGLAVWSSFGGTIPLKAKGWRFHVLFTQAPQLASNADVRISGVDVGKVKSVAHEGERTNATIEVDPEFAPLPASTRAILRRKTLLGETFVELTPAPHRPPYLDDGATLPVEQVDDVQQLDQVIDAFDRPTREALKRFLDGTARSFAGRGEDANQALGAFAPATRSLGTLARVLDRQRPALAGLVRDSGTVLRGLGRRDTDLAGLVSAGDALFSATASRDRALRGLVERLPGFLDQTRATLGEAERMAVHAGPTLRALRPVAPLLRPATAEAAKLSDELRRLFTALPPVLDHARTALPAAGRLLDATRPLLGMLAPAGRELVPVVQLIGRYRKELVATFANVAAGANGKAPAANGKEVNVLRGPIIATNEAFMGWEQRANSNRHNPYPAPGELAELGKGGLLASDCRNVDNPTVLQSPLGAPPCKVQPPWTFQGATRYYPHVEPDPP